MTRVVILGGGFAGLAAARQLRKLRGRAEVILVDRRPSSDFLPLVGDLLYRRIDPRLLQSDLASLAGPLGFRFLNTEATGIDLAGKSLSTSAGPLHWDYLILAAGAEPNFYGTEALRAQTFPLASVADAGRIVSALERDGYAAVLVVGGSYTGVEAATGLRRRLGPDGLPVLIAEQAPTLVPERDAWVRDYVETNCRAMGVEVLCGTTLTGVRGRDAALSNGRVVKNALVLWAAGVAAGPVVRRLDVEKDAQGRLVVDEFLRLNDSVFVAGDSACVMHKGKAVRMAIQPALDQGRTAGANVRALIEGRPLRRYRPVDLGWIVPMANSRSCGKALGVPVRGFAATALHYLMCLWRTPGLARRARILRRLLAR